MVLTLFGITLFAVEEYIILDLIHVSENENVSFLRQLIFFLLFQKNKGKKRQTASHYAKENSNP